MDTPVARPKVPIPVAIVVVIALVVVALLLAQAAVSFFLGIVRLVLILAAFAGIAVVGLFLWRRGGTS